MVMTIVNVISIVNGDITIVNSGNCCECHNYCECGNYYE